MGNTLLLPEIAELLRKKKFDFLREFISEMHEKEAADYLSSLSPSDIWKILNLFDAHKRADVFSYMDMDVQVKMISGGLKRHVLDLLTPMSTDDRADLFQHLDKHVADKLLTYLPSRERADVLHLTSYEEGTAGALMSSDFVALHENDTVASAIKTIRKIAPGKETVYYTYILNDSGVLLGFLSLRKLILSKPQVLVREIMKTDVIVVAATDDQEKASNLINDYDLIAIPVVNSDNKMLGIITYDDAIDIIREEQTEDMERLMAISGPVEEKPYLDIGILTHFRKRVVWVVILGFFGILTGMIIQGFQKTLETLIVLTFYMPLLNAAGGNTGSQSATVVLRSLALDQLKPGDIFRVLKKEFVISALLALCLGIITFLRVHLLTAPDQIGAEFTLLSVATVIALALSIQVVWSTLFGAIIPIIAVKVKIDPAVFSSPALSTIVDMGGVVIYFSIAKMILGI